MTFDQLAAIVRTVVRQRTYLEKLKARMEQMQFTDGDPLNVAVVQAWQYAEQLAAVAGDLERLARFTTTVGTRPPAQPTRDPRARRT